MKSSLSLALLLSSLVATATGCGISSSAETVSNADEIVNVDHTDVERQSIGNCWLYAHATWIESMNKSATGKAFDVSQSYWTYWHWFDQIAGGSASAEVSTGGNWSTANNLVRKYGLMAEKDFVADDSTNEMSSRQASALATMNDSLKTGVLKDPTSRRNKKLVECLQPNRRVLVEVKIQAPAK